MVDGDNKKSISVKVRISDEYREFAKSFSGKALEIKIASESKMIDSCKLSNRIGCSKNNFKK